MTEYKKDIWEIISSVLNDTVTDEEKNLFEHWLNENEANKSIYETLQNTGIKDKLYPVEVRDKIFNSLQKGILESGYIRSLKIWKYGVAASLAVIVTLSFFLLNKNPEVKNVAQIEITCPTGNKSKVLLPDGTLVYLNAGSSLSYPAQFSDDVRKVVLKGEAYFDVSKDADHPFIVQTDSIYVRVFGTSFNVKNYPEDNNIETTLREGSVAVYKASDAHYRQGINIVPNQQVVYNKQTGSLEKRNVDAELSSIWLEGKFYFEKEDLKSIVKKLERNYNVQIRIQSEKLNHLVFTGLIDKRLNIFQTLDIMKRYNHFDYNFSRDSICIIDE